MFVAWITTGTGEPVLIVVSGKLNGLALMGTPLMLATVITGGGTVGRFKAKGREFTWLPEPTPIPAMLLASRRRSPDEAIVEQTLPPPFPTRIELPKPVIEFA